MPLLTPPVCAYMVSASKPLFSILVAARKDTAIQLEDNIESTAFCLSFQRTNSLAEKIPEAIWSEAKMGPEVTGSVHTGILLGLGCVCFLTLNPGQC